MVITGTADGGHDAIRLDGELRPDVVLMDVCMPGLDGIEATRRICENRPDASVVMLTASIDHGCVIGALDAGAVGYLVKDADPAVLRAAVLAAAAGAAPLDPRAARAVLDTRAKAAMPLTGRETEVLESVAEGLTNKAIARRLGISEKTVKAHLTRVFAGLGVSDRTQAALWAREHLVVPTPV